MGFVVFLIVFIFMANLGSANPDVMSFNKAIDAVSLGNYNMINGGYTMIDPHSRPRIGELEQAPFVDEKGITGILAWHAPNGTIYQVEYPSERVLGKIAKLIFSDYNPPLDGHIFWWLNYDEEIDREYWVDVSDGSIIFIWEPPPRGHNQPNPPNDTSAIINPIIYSLIPAIAVIAITAAAVLMFKRRSKQKLNRPSLDAS